MLKVKKKKKEKKISIEKISKKKNKEKDIFDNIPNLIELLIPDCIDEKRDYNISIS